MKLSVIMLTYNRETFVQQAIESIISQTFCDFEFIIVDNGSTDRSGVIAEEYAIKDNRIRVIHRSRGSIGSGRNAGLEAAKGEYITFIDDDDWCEPDFLAFLYNLILQSGADVAICGAIKEEKETSSTVGIEEKTVYNAENAIIELMWRKRFNNGFPTKLFKKSLFDQLRFPEASRYDDIHLMYKVLANATSIVSFGLPKYHVRRHDGNNSVATTKDFMITPQYLNDYRIAYRERTRWLCNRFPENASYWWYFDWSFLISMVHRISINRLEECNLHLQEMKQELSQHHLEFLESPYTLNFEKEWIKRYV